MAIKMEFSLAEMGTLIDAITDSINTVESLCKEEPTESLEIELSNLDALLNKVLALYPAKGE